MNSGFSIDHDTKMAVSLSPTEKLGSGKLRFHCTLQYRTITSVEWAAWLTCVGTEIVTVYAHVFCIEQRPTNEMLCVNAESYSSGAHMSHTMG